MFKCFLVILYHKNLEASLLNNGYTDCFVNSKASMKFPSTNPNQTKRKGNRIKKLSWDWCWDRNRVWNCTRRHSPCASDSAIKGDVVPKGFLAIIFYNRWRGFIISTEYLGRTAFGITGETEISWRAVWVPTWSSADWWGSHVKCYFFEDSKGSGRLKKKGGYLCCISMRAFK